MHQTDYSADRENYFEPLPFVGAIEVNSNYNEINSDDKSQIINDINKINSDFPSQPPEVSTSNILINNLNNKNTENNKNENFVNDNLDINALNANFTSRDLVKIFIHLSNNKQYITDVNNVTKAELSMKGIKFWETLSTNLKFKFLFKRYKPWSLHTSYKRLFSKTTVQEISKLLMEDPEADLNTLTNLFAKKKINKNELLRKKIRRSILVSDSEEGDENNSYQVKYSKNGRGLDINIDLAEKENYNLSNKFKLKNDLTYLNCDLKGIITEKIKLDPNKSYNSNKFQDYLQKQTGLKKDYFFFIDNIKKVNSLRDELSDSFDDLNNQHENIIKSIFIFFIILDVDYLQYMRICYLTLLDNEQNNLEVIRKFNNINIEQDKEITNFYHIFRQIKSEFENKYDDKFIIESMMKTSNDESDLRLYLSNPLHNQGNI